MPPLRVLGKGGPRARLSFSGIRFFPGIALAGCLLSAPPPRAAETPLQSLLDLDEEIRIWMPSEPALPSLDRVPGFAGDPRFSAALGFAYRDLLRKSGSFAFDHSENLASLSVSSTALPHLGLRFAAERSRRDLDLGDSSARFDAGGSGWEWTGSIAYRFSPWLVPAVSVGGDTRMEHGNSLRSLSLRGGAAGFEWALALGENDLDQPVVLDVEGYDRISLPIQVRRRFRDLALRYRRGPWRADAAARWTRPRYPWVRAEAYALGDSGSAWKYSAGGAYDRLGPGAGYRASLGLDIGYGRHHFQGTDRKEDGLRTFSRQSGIQKSYSLRADLRIARAGWDWGAYAEGGELELDALRPEVAFNNYFWDRNGVIDSYRGGLLGIFDNETWLFNGAAYLSRAGGGLWAEKSLGGWRGRLGAGYQYLVLESRAHLTERRTTFLFAYRERDSDRAYPRVRADLVTPEIRVEKAWGSCYAAASAAQALPLRVRSERDGGGGNDPVTDSDGSRYSGGTKAGLELGWRLP